MKKYTTNEFFEEIKAFYLRHKEVERMKNRVLPSDSPFLKDSGVRSYQTRTILEIGEKMKKLVLQVRELIEKTSKV